MKSFKTTLFKTALFKTMLFRMWAAGAVCFFAAWGRTGAIETNTFFSLELIFSLILLMILGDMLIVNPVIRLASGKRALGEAKSSSAFLTGGLLHAAKVSFIMLFIVITYYFLNVLFIRFLNLDTQSVPVPLEPLLFGILYGLYYLFFEVAGKFIIKNKEEKRSETR
ncbi:MAG: hypothetical protein LBB72_04540 [Spirochaetaceae bacterium]|jgi:hypothetical protein|nr:hypothetical protein [Spirochaetaceae bacterium]